jgi:hypothetical protein
MSATLRERVSHWWLERRARKSITSFERLSLLWGGTSQAGVAVRCTNRDAIGSGLQLRAGACAIHRDAAALRLRHR